MKMQQNHETNLFLKQGDGPVAMVYHNRDTRLFPDACIALEETALVLDREKGELSTRLCFRSLASKSVVAMQAMVQCMDIWGDLLGEPVLANYMDMYVEPGDRFGQNVAIALPDGMTRRVGVTVKRVMLTDGTVLTCNSEPEILPAPVSLADHLGGKELAHEYALRTTAKAQFVPQPGEKYWRCTCGSIHRNSVAVCARCGSDLPSLTCALSRDTLLAAMQLRLAQQPKNPVVTEQTIPVSTATHTLPQMQPVQPDIQPQSEPVVQSIFAEQPDIPMQPAFEELFGFQAEIAPVAQPKPQKAKAKKEKKAQNNQAQKEKKAKGKHPIRNAILWLLILGTLAAAAYFVAPPAYRYYQANQALKAGDYDAAYQQFYELGNFLNSGDLAQYALYNKGITLYNDGDWAEAYQTFLAIPDDENAPEMLDASVYAWTDSILENLEDTQQADLYQSVVALTPAQSEVVYQKVINKMNDTYSDTYDVSAWNCRESHRTSLKSIFSAFPQEHSDAAAMMALMDEFAPQNYYDSTFLSRNESNLREVGDVQFVKRFVMKDALAWKFLNGRWEAKDSNYYFTVGFNNSINTSLPHEAYSGQYTIVHSSIYGVEELDYTTSRWSSEVHMVSVLKYRITVLDYDTIEIYNTYNGRTYTMSRT